MIEFRSNGNKHWVGKTFKSRPGAIRIGIDPDQFSFASDLDRDFTIWHELGHGFLGTQHDAGIMGSATPPDSVFQANRELYFDHLFFAITETRNKVWVIQWY